MSYYNWPKIMEKFSDVELGKIIRDQHATAEDKLMAAYNELKNRGIETDNYAQMIEIIKDNASKSDNIYAGFWSRLASLLLDFVFLLPITLLTLYMNSLTKNFYFYTLIPNIFVMLWYNVYLVKKYGGTPGKLIAGIQILKLNGQQIAWKEAILRHLVLFILTVFGSILMSVALLNADAAYFESLNWMNKQQYLITLSPIMFGIFSWANNIWVYGELIVLLTNKKKRAIHDFIAGTVIVKTKYMDRVSEVFIHQK